MDARCRFTVVEMPRRNQLTGGPSVLGIGMREIARRDGNVYEGQHPLRGIELAPGRPRLRRHCPAPDEQLACETGWRTTELKGTGIMHPGQRGTEVLSGDGRRRS